MAALISNQEILRKLSFGDVTSNELYYHRECYQDFRNEYNREEKKLRETNTDRRMEEWTKASTLSKIVRHIYETERDIPGI